jgi:two-component system, NarL family, invasion response regulator UvrY
MKNILSIDDHGIVVAGLEQIAFNIKAGWSFGSASNPGEAYQLLRETDWDLIVLDISLDGKSGLELLQDFKEMYPEIPILIFSFHTGIEFVRRSLKLGASGYVTKDSTEKEIGEAIEIILRGGNYINDEFRDELIFTTKSGDHTKLSEREFEVLIRIGDGFTTREIADALNISANTVDTYRARIKEKMNLKRDSQIIHYCIAAGLIKINPHFK